MWELVVAKGEMEYIPDVMMHFSTLSFTFTLFYMHLYEIFLAQNDDSLLLANGVPPILIHAKFHCI